MLEELSYQLIINLIGQMMLVSMPIGILFGLTEKLINLFFSMAFGSKNIKI